MRLEEQPGRKWVKNKDMDSMSGRCSVIARLPAATEEVGGPSRLEQDPRLKEGFGQGRLEVGGRCRQKSNQLGGVWETRGRGAA